MPRSWTGEDERVNARSEKSGVTRWYQVNVNYHTWNAQLPTTGGLRLQVRVQGSLSRTLGYQGLQRHALGVQVALSREGGVKGSCVAPEL
mmetsp:Transcript_27550/g.62522  ORF Transcript_27550/g.62522 Transcript_27550/m.62522 type:complete len:90 (+) Transcript_27550:1226-1495(+)